LYRMYRGGRDHPVSFATKGLMIAGVTLAILASNWDNDEYEELPEWDKDLYWHIWVGGEHIRVPKPFEIGALFATIPERFIRLSTGRDDMELAANRMLTMASDTFAFNPVPQLVKPMVEQFANRDFFTGSPIVGFAEQGRIPEAQFNPWTSEATVEMGRLTGLSPQRMEHVVRGYLGATGMYILGAADYMTRHAFGYPEAPTTAIQDYPVVKRFWRNPNPRYTKYSDQLYDMMDESNALFRTINAYKKQGLVEEARDIFTDNRSKLRVRKQLNDLTTKVREINGELRKIHASRMSARSKAARIDRLTRRKNSIMRRVEKFSHLF